MPRLQRPGEPPEGIAPTTGVSPPTASTGGSLPGESTAFSRVERLGRVDSTQRIVREWLAAGVPEICVAVADEQTAGRGRLDRRWTAPSGTALLLSCGLRPAGLALQGAWRLGALLALAMIDAAEATGLPDGTLWLKWPNDLAADGPDGLPLKLAGILGETVADPDGMVASAVVGIGVNVDWPAADFPGDLASTMTSLRELAHRPVDREALLDGFLARLEPRYEALRTDHFDAAGWTGRQRTTGSWLEVEAGDERLVGRGAGVDPDSGALLIDVEGRVRAIGTGEVLRCLVRRSEWD